MPKMHLPEAAILCVMRHRYGYRGYETSEKAQAALRRRSPDVPRQDLKDAFAAAAAMYSRAEALVWASRHHLQQEEALGLLEAQLLREFPLFGAVAAREAIKWAYYWRILR